MAAVAPTSNEAPLSVVAMQIVKESLREDTSVAKLARFVEADPAFALRVLSIANSAAFGSTRKVSDVRHAAMMLGVRGLRNVGMSLALTDMVPRNESGSILLSCCLRRATACRLLAQAVQMPDVERAFMTGLFLDVGLLSLARSNLDSATDIARQPASSRSVYERSLGLGDHMQVGAGVAREFSLPDELVEAITSHHDAMPPEAPLARLAWVAERLAATYEGGDDSDLKASARAATALLGVSAAASDEIFVTLPSLTASVASDMGCESITEQSLTATLVDVNRGLADLNLNYAAVIRQLDLLIQERERLAESLQEANRKLEALAMTDPLTGLSNRRAVDAALHRDLARADRESGWVSLVAFDVDFFKKVNDTYGHAAGDEVLKAVAHVLSRGLRAGDLAARVGGEEFWAILPNTDPAGALVTAERLRATLEAHSITAEGQKLAVTASFGVASVKGPGCGRAAKSLAEHADEAVYAAKRTGRNRVMVAA